MSQRIVLFESNPEFAEEVRAGFAALGVPVDSYDDPMTGVEAAAANPPRLILLTVELAEMNGFLVCKKIKKTPGIDATPLIILSNDPNADEIFEQHKKLRTRADDYLKKPVDFATVLEHARALVSLDASRSTEVGDAEIDAFADSAFGTLVEDASENLLEVEEELTEIDVEAEVAVVEERAPVMAASAPSVPPPAPAAPVAAASNDAELQAKVARLEAELLSAQGEAAAVVSLRAQVAELTTRVAKGASGVSSRDYLDLREALNSKDKEILDFRDQLSARDKQLIELRDQNLGHARTKADLDDRIFELESKVTTATQQLEVAASDSANATKRFEDLKGRFERSEAKLQKLEETFETAKATHAAESAAAREANAEALASAEAKHANAIAAAKADLEAQSSANASALADAESRRAAEVASLRAAHDEEQASLRAGHDENLAAKLAEHAAAIMAAADAASSEKESALSLLRSEHAAAREADSNTAAENLASELARVATLHASALSERETELATKHEGERRLAEDDHARQLALLGRKLADTEGRASTAESTLAETQSKLADIEAQLADATSRVAQREQSIAELEEAKAALGADLGNRVTELDAARSEGEGLRATIAAVEQVASERSGRIDSLEAERTKLHAELEEARRRISSDAEVTARVHRALSIGLGLLEEQKQSVAAE